MQDGNSNKDTADATVQSHTLPEGPVGFEERARLPFPVVGVGASAGGVEALSSFFRATPPESGIAFVVIQHLPPDNQSLMAEILGRCTQMPVVQIDDGMRIRPNCVYVIRPGFTVTLADGQLQLGEPVEKRGHRRPVDDFFRSLAQEQKEKSIIVILSGTGTNGTAGAQAIKAAGGLCVAQDPDSADFPGMPRSLIHSGYADQVLPPDAIPGFLVAYVRHPFIESPTVEGASAAAHDLQRERQSLSEIQALLRTRTTHDFRGYRKPTLLRRIQRRMGIVGVAQLPEYAQVLRDRADEALSLANDLMINVTGFFRDPDAWEALREGAIAPLVDTRMPGDPLRAWVSACSSGEEAYSLAILIAEECERVRKPLEVKIFATDTADKSLALARAGVYPGGVEGDITQERLERFFDKDDHTYRIKKEIRDMVVFAPQNLLRDPPFSRVDLCTCRNLLIYLEPETQKRVLALLSFAVTDGGYLFLGNTESLGEAEQNFETLSKRWRIYRRVGAAQRRFVDIPYSPRLALQDALDGPQSGRALLPALPSTISYERALLDEFAPTSVIVDRQERMLYVHGDTAPFLAYPQGELTTSIIEAARPALRAAVRNVFQQAAETHVAATVDCQLEADDDTLRVRVTAAPLKGRAAGRNLRVSFELRPQAARGGGGGKEAAADLELLLEPHPLLLPSNNGLEDELRILRRELQASVEAFEANNEELKASHEEVLSVNEELQSANEELETSKEELQSLNEELTTVNSQLQAKILEQEHTTNDLSNLLSSTSIAVVFLDTQLLVRRFTPAVQDLLELIPTDVGRSISDLAPKFTTVGGQSAPHGALRGIARAVLDNLTPVETEVRSDSGRWYLHRTLPYRTLDNHIEGVVLTFVDISARKAAEQSVAHIQARLQTALEQMPAAIIIADAPDGTIRYANRRAAALFGQPYPPPFLNLEWKAAVRVLKGWHPDGRSYQGQEWPLARSLATGEIVVGEQIEIPAEGGRATLSVSSAALRDDNDNAIAAVTAFWDITQLKAAERGLRESERRLRLIVENSHEFAILMLDIAGNVTAWNSGAELIFGWTEAEMLGRSPERIFTPADREAEIPEREMRTALKDGRSEDQRWHMRKGGTPFWANGVLSVARDESGSVIGFVKILRNSTQQKEAEDRLQAATQLAAEAQASAEAANHAKDDFISMISHELRTPLNTMRLWVRLLGHEALPDKDRLEGRLTLERAIISQQQLIDDLLDVSRIANGKLRLDLRPTRLAEAIETAIDAVRPVAVRKGVELTYEASPLIGVVRADPDRMQQVVWNLLSNAVKFTPSGGRVAVELLRDEDWVTIEVMDTGIGIREELLPHIFDRFLQGESGAARQHTGLGLGLAISKQLVELHHGTISARSEGEGKGAVFVVRLPFKAESLEAEFASPPGEGAAAGLDGLQVLLVEDEPSAREGTRALLQAARANVQPVESATAAREAYMVRRPDVIVSDIGLPGEDGYALLQQIRSMEREQGSARVPALALTAFARSEDRERAIEAGFDVHVAKPVDPDRLMEQIARLTGRRPR